MTDPGAIHDLLERAVHEHRPAVADPTRAVLARARRDRRRALTGLAVGLVLVLGAGGLLGVLDPGRGGTGPASGGEGRAAIWTSGQPDDALGRARADDEGDLLVRQAAEALRRREAEAAALAAARAAEGAGTLSVTPTVSFTVPVPDGWPTLTGDSGSDPQDLPCLDTATVYRVTIRLGNVDVPCLGEPATPYLWDTGGLPRVDAVVEQEILAEGTPQWVQDSVSLSGATVIDVYFPASGQHVQAAGMDLETLRALLQPGGSTPGRPLLPTSIENSTLRISTGSGSAVPVPAAAADALLSELRGLPVLDAVSRGGCFGAHPGPAGHWQLELRSPSTGIGLLVVDVPTQGCGAVASSFGGVGRVSDALVALLTTLQ